MEAFLDYAYRAVILDESVWLGQNTTWESLRDESGGRLKPQPWHYQYVLILTVGALLLRALLDRILFLPLGRLLKISEAPPAPPSRNHAAEKLYRSTKKPSQSQIQEVASINGWSEQKVHHWLKRKREASDRSKMPKFQEACWRFLGYASLLVFGFWSLKDTDYISDTRLCWTNYPHETIPVRVFWYYMLELGFYASLTCSHFFDTKRKDFWEMLVHHFVTIGLIVFSYMCKVVAIGSLIMFVHDMADPFLELAKALSYTRPKDGASQSRVGPQLAVDILFAIFAVIFWVTRLYVYPRFLIFSVWVESEQEMGPWPFRIPFLILLNTLVLLHVFWSYLILKVVLKAFREGAVGEDSRSDDEDENPLDENDTAKVHKTGMNGSKRSMAADSTGVSTVRERPSHR